MEEEKGKTKRFVRLSWFWPAAPKGQKTSNREAKYTGLGDMNLLETTTITKKKINNKNNK